MHKMPRLPYIDHAKSIGILLMILGHIWTVDPAIRQFIYAFHMPLFFIIAGFLYKHVSFRQRIAKDWRSLLLPYLLVNFCCMAIRLFVPLFTEPGYPFWQHFFAQAGAILTGESLPQYGLEPVCGPSWFILAIFFLHMLRYIPLPGFLISALSITIAWLLRHFQIVIPGPLDAAVMAYPFFYAGSLLRRIDWQRIAGPRVVIILALSLFLTWIMNRDNGPVDINTLQYGRNLAVYYLCACTGTMAVWTLCLLLERLSWRWLDAFAAVMAAGTIVVVGFHRFFLAAAEHLLPMTPIQSLFVGLAVFMAFFPINLFCEKHIPLLTGFRRS